MLSLEIINEAKKLCPRAEMKIFDLTYRLLLSISMRYLKNEEDAKDCLMEAYVKFYAALSKFQFLNEAATMGFLKRCLINECLGHLRSNKSLNIFSNIKIEDSPIDNKALDALAINDLLEIISELPVGYRTVFNLYEIEGFQHNEIADLLRISVGTSKSQLYKAKQLLQRAVAQKQNYYAKQG